SSKSRAPARRPSSASFRRHPRRARCNVEPKGSPLRRGFLFRRAGFIRRPSVRMNSHLSAFEPPQHRHRNRDEGEDRKCRGEQRWPVVDDAEIREQPSQKEEYEAENCPGEDAKADAAGAALKI